MLHSIRLVNFQSHKDSLIEFHPGVNVIIGPSRHGKTAILRALRWVVENRPSGDEFRSHWSGKKDHTMVQITLDNGKVERTKSNSLNVYSVKIPDSDRIYSTPRENFHGFGQDVPKPVTDLLNLAPINYQDQFSAPFLLFDSPGAVARYLNSVVHLEKIDAGLAAVASLKRQNDQDIRVQNTRIKSLEELEESFPDLEAAEEFIAELEGSQADRDAKEYTRSRLEEIQNNLFNLEANLTLVKIPDWIETKTVELFNQEDVRERLGYTKYLLVGLQADLAEARLKQIQLAPALRQGPQADKLTTLNNHLIGNRKTLGRLRNYAATLDTKRESLSSVLAIIKKEETKFKDLMPNICPLCGK